MAQAGDAAALLGSGWVPRDAYVCNASMSVERWLAGTPTLRSSPMTPPAVRRSTVTVESESPRVEKNCPNVVCDDLTGQRNFGGDSRRIRLPNGMAHATTPAPPRMRPGRNPTRLVGVAPPSLGGVWPADRCLGWGTHHPGVREEV